MEPIGNLIEEVVDLARQINSDVDTNDVQELLDFHNQKLTTDRNVTHSKLQSRLMRTSNQVYAASQYGGYDPRLVTEWERIPNKAWLHLLQGKEVGLSPVMDFRPEWKAAHPVCYMLVSSFVRNVYILLFVLYVSVLPLVFHMYTRIKTDDNNNNNESLLNKRSMHVKFKVRMPNGSGDLVISE
ncbi:hypothetical protein TNCV_4500191 [Trichonephila clavipes]|nr:hypothetical protein TNCV_4500191 [Trichonephila clavipes]